MSEPQIPPLSAPGDDPWQKAKYATVHGPIWKALELIDAALAAERRTHAEALDALMRQLAQAKEEHFSHRPSLNCTCMACRFDEARSHATIGRLELAAAQDEIARLKVERDSPQYVRCLTNHYFTAQKDGPFWPVKCPFCYAEAAPASWWAQNPHGTRTVTLHDDRSDDLG